MGPRCHDPVKAVRGVRGAARRQIMMSAVAMLKMNMLDLVWRLGHRTMVTMTRTLPVMPTTMMMLYRAMNTA